MPADFDFEAAGAAISADLGFSSEGDDDGLGFLDSPADTDSGQPADAPPAPAPSPAAAAPAVGSPAPAPAGTPAPAPAAELTEPPKTWRKEAAAEWAALSPTIKAEIAKREQDIFQGLEGYKSDASFGRTVQQALQPYLPTLRQYNLDPIAQVSGLMQAHFNLATGTPEAKLATFQRLAKDYNIPLEGLAQAPEDQLYVDPAVKALRSELDSVKSNLTAAQQVSAREAEAKLVKDIEAFAADPKNPHFKDVAHDMIRLLETRAATTLQAAYEQAIWTNPAVRAKEISRQQAETASAAAAAEAAKAEAARKATGANVKPKPKSAGAATPLGSIDDTLAETLAAIRSRN